MTLRISVPMQLLHLGKSCENSNIKIYILLCRGLLASKMYETAKAIVRNLLSLVEAYGFVLNGARAYYTNRR